ncbi:hypothetical protein WJX79_002401 [Trebouxia sp. C0005]
MSAASRDRDPASIESRKQKLRALIAEEKQKHELKIKGWSDKLKELDAVGRTHDNQKSQQARTTLVFLQACSVPYEQSQANGTSWHDQPEDSGDEYDTSSSSSLSQGPPGFSSTVRGLQAPQTGHTPLSNGRHPMPATKSGELRDRGSLAGPKGTSATALDDVPPGYGPRPQAAAQRTPLGYGSQPARQAPAGGWAGGATGSVAQPYSSNIRGTQGEGELPGREFGIRTNSVRDFDDNHLMFKGANDRWPGVLKYRWIILLVHWVTLADILHLMEELKPDMQNSTHQIEI